MFELNGKFNTCKVFTDNVDNETISQLTLLLNQPFVKDSNIRIMPDTHAGKGCVVGTTMTIDSQICPNLVGVDIGCGMLAVQIEETEVDFQKLDEIIHQYIPSGFNVRDRIVASSNAAQIIASVNVSLAMRSLGTLGGGNHFIECDKDDDGNVWLVVHTGSRHLGLEVCKYYQDLAWKKLHKRSDIIAETVARLKSEGRQEEIEGAIKSIKSSKVVIPKDLAYVQGEDFDNYIHDMRITQEHAKINRETIVEIICSYMGWHVKDQIHSIHNYIDTENMILRKGSVSAQSGERIIIPMNMRDGGLICVGKGNPDWNFSAPHGAGRLMSRGRAKENISLEEYQDSMNGIYSTCVGYSTIDESPMAYKPMSEILNAIRDTADVVDIIKPIYNFKAS